MNYGDTVLIKKTGKKDIFVERVGRLFRLMTAGWVEASEVENATKPGKKRGLGSSSIDPAKAKLIHSLGGKASHGGGRPKGSKVVKGRDEYGENEL